MTKLSRNYYLFATTVLLCFAIGFGIAAFPDRWHALRGQPTDRIVILTSGSKVLPAQFLLDYEKATGRGTEIRVVESYHLFRTEAGSADLLFAPLSWLGNFPEILDVLPDQENFAQLLSTDFQTLNLELKSFLPLLWKTEEREGRTHLMIWGFARPKSAQRDVREFLNFLLTSDRRAQQWVQVSGMNITLQRSNEIKSFPDSQRALRIRDVSLPKLVIDQKMEF